MVKKAKVIVQQCKDANSPGNFVYLVVKLVNRMQPEVGAVITKGQLEHLIRDSRTTVEIEPTK
jgi:hypothetical protein